MKKIGIYTTLCALFMIIGCKKDGREEITSTPLSVSGNELINYVSYCNDRFDVCIDYPSNFGAQPEPINGDGRTFFNKIDSAEIVLYGFIDHGKEGLETQLDILNEAVEIEELTETANGFEIYGTERDQQQIVHRELMIIKPDKLANKQANGQAVDIIASLIFTYPKNKADKYDAYWTKIKENFE